MRNHHPSKSHDASQEDDLSKIKSDHEALQRKYNELLTKYEGVQEEREKYRHRCAHLKDFIRNLKGEFLSLKKLFLKETKARNHRENNLYKIIASALAWQMRSPVKRAFHRWKISTHHFKKFPFLYELVHQMNSKGIHEDINPAPHEINSPVMSELDRLSNDATLVLCRDIHPTNREIFNLVQPSDILLKNRDTALIDAYHMILKGEDAEGIKHAEKYQYPEHLSSVALLKSNYFLKHKNEEQWLFHLNQYIDSFDLAPIYLKEGNNLLERLAVEKLPDRNEGVLISVIMPARNAENTIEAAVRSILDQTWKNLELIVVDDLSTDHTWKLIQNLSSQDQRVKAYRNPVNVGPYVSKNVGLKFAKGAWITGHDADDWAHPQRLERHYEAVTREVKPVRASVTYMVRMQESGFFDTFVEKCDFSPDGVTRIASISCFLEANFFHAYLGSWDCVRFGGDTELISRAKRILGSEFKSFFQMGMICLSSEQGLTNHPQFGLRTVDGGFSWIRQAYYNAFSEWHKTASIRDFNYQFPSDSHRSFSVPHEMKISQDAIQQLCESYRL